MEKLTYDIFFNDEGNCNNKGFEESFDYCVHYIKMYNGTNESYFADYEGGTVEIMCNQTRDIVHREKVLIRRSK